MAGRIPQSFMDELLSRVDIVDVIHLRVPLKKSGANHMACCPFHGEKTPSFSVSQPRQFYHCFGCGVSGNAIRFLMEYENLHFVDAVETLADSVGLEVPREAGGPSDSARQQSRTQYELLEVVASHYQQALRDAPQAVEYLKHRGLDGETAKRFGLGYAVDGWDRLQQAFPGREADLLTTGMLKRNDAGRVYPRFRDRVMFPIRDRRGRVIAFGGRVMGNDEPKYLNSPETPLFHKGSELYALWESGRAIRSQGMVIVVEGYMDVVALSQHGVHNAVATLGTAANQQHSETLFRAVPNIVFCFDGDRAGRAAAWRALTATLPCLADGKDAHFLFLPDGEDPDSIVSERGAAGFNDLLAERVPIIDFLYQQLASELDIRSIGGKAQLAEKARPLVEQIPRGIYRQLALRRLEALIGLPMGSRQAAAPRQPPSRQAAADDTRLTPMRCAILLVLQHPALVAHVPEQERAFDPEEPGGDILARLLDYCTDDPAINTARLVERFNGTDTHRHLTRLATRHYWPDRRELSEDDALAAFRDVLSLLRRRQGRSASQVAPGAQLGLLNKRRRTL